jgi:hypothetical protein
VNNKKRNGLKIAECLSGITAKAKNRVALWTFLKSSIEKRRVSSLRGTLLLILLVLNSLLCQSMVVVKTNLSDCANCTLFFSELQKMKAIDTLFVLFPNKFQRNEADIKEKYGFEKMDQISFLFNDSLYKQLDEFNMSFTSEIYVLNTKKSIIYSADLKSMNLAAIKYFAQHAQGNIFTIPSLEKVNLSDYQTQQNKVLAQDYFKTLFLVDLKTKKLKRIKSNEKLVQGIYKRHFGKDFQGGYAVMKNLFKKYPTIKPRLEKATIANKGNDLLMLYVYRYFEDHGNDDTVVVSSAMLVNYNIHSEKYKTFLMPDKNWRSKKRSLYKWAKFLGKPYLLSEITTKNSKKDFPSISFAPIELDNGKKVFREKEGVITGFYPSDYFKNKGSYLYRGSLHLSDMTIMPTFSDSIYNVALKKKIRVPYKRKRAHFKQYTSYANSYNPYTKTYQVLYSFEKGKAYFILCFKQDGRVIKDEIVLDSKGKRVAGILNFYHPHQILYFNHTEGSFRTVDL